MAYVFVMPRLSHDMRSGNLVEWLRKEGDEVAVGDPLLTIEIDKAAMEIEAERSGVLHRILVTEDAGEVACFTPLAIFRNRDETDVNVEALLDEFYRES